MIGMPYAGELTNNSFTVIKIQFMKFKQFNIFLPHPSMHRMHGAAIGAVAGIGGRVVLVGASTKVPLGYMMPGLPFPRISRSVG